MACVCRGSFRTAFLRIAVFLTFLCTELLLIRRKVSRKYPAKKGQEPYSAICPGLFFYNLYSPFFPAVS